MTDDKIKKVYDGIDTLQAEIEIGDFIKCEIRNLRKKSVARLEAAKEAIKDQTAEIERLNGQIDALSERVAIMQEGRDGWHFSGTPEIPVGKDQVTVIVWADNGQIYPLNYCLTTIRGKETYRYEWMYWRVYGRDDTIKAWRYLPKAPEGVEG